MSTYEITLEVLLEVEADDEEEARDLATFCEVWLSLLQFFHDSWREGELDCIVDVVKL